MKGGDHITMRGLRKMRDVPSGCIRFATIVMLGVLAAAMPGYFPAAKAETARDACTQDAFRLCSDTIPDVARTKACLARHRGSLSPLCRAAFSGRGAGRHYRAQAGHYRHRRYYDRY
jgi:hypothetical protein